MRNVIISALTITASFSMATVANSAPHPTDHEICITIAGETFCTDDVTTLAVPQLDTKGNQPAFNPPVDDGASDQTVSGSTRFVPPVNDGAPERSGDAGTR